MHSPVNKAGCLRAAAPQEGKISQDGLFFVRKRRKYVDYRSRDGVPNVTFIITLALTLEQSGNLQHHFGLEQHLNLAAAWRSFYIYVFYLGPESGNQTALELVSGADFGCILRHFSG